MFPSYVHPKWQKTRDVLKMSWNFKFFFCPENKNFVCPGLHYTSTALGRHSILAFFTCPWQKLYWYVYACVDLVQVFASMHDLLMTEEDDSDRMMHNIHDLATQLYQNVCVRLCVCLSSRHTPRRLGVWRLQPSVPIQDWIIHSQKIPSTIERSVGSTAQSVRLSVSLSLYVFLCLLLFLCLWFRISSCRSDDE